MDLLETYNYLNDKVTLCTAVAMFVLKINVKDFFIKINKDMVNSVI